MKTYLISLFYQYLYPQLLSMVLVIGGIWSVGFGMTTHIKGLGQVSLLWIGFLGVIAGRLSARMIRSPWKGITLAAVIGSVYLLVKIGGLVPRVWMAVWSLSLPDLLNARLQDWSLPAWAFSELFRGVGVVVNRLAAWVLTFLSGSAVYDPLASAWIWGSALWFVSSWAGWGAAKRWSGIQLFLPALILLSAVLGYVRGSVFSLAMLLALTMFTSLVIDQTRREHRWSFRNTDFSNEIRIDLAMVGMAVTLLLITASLVVSSISVSKILESVDRWMKPVVTSNSPLGEPLGLVQQPQAISPVSGLLYPGLPRNHLIGSGPELSDRLVMTVRTNELPPMPSQSLKEPPHPYYWRGVTYDRYTGNGWATSASFMSRVRQDIVLASVTDPTLYRRLDQEFDQIQTQRGLVFYTGQLLKAQQSFEVYKRTGEDLFAAYISADSYQVESWVPTFTRDMASETGRDYPEWIRNRYLSLPEELPDRVLSLAVQISASGTTPYEQVLAIENYLRTIPYNLDLPAPPGNRDIVDYFLFDLKQGYCDYYASAMVVLVRSIGIPARLVVGYASGSYDSLNAVYRVTEADAHSWPEVYFPGLGWIEFEPTASRPVISDLNTPPAPPPDDPDLSADTRDVSGVDPLAENPLPWITGAVVLMALLWLGLPGILDYRFLKTLPPAAAIHLLNQRLWMTAYQRKLPVTRGDTPIELASKIADYLKPLEVCPRWVKYLVDPLDIERLTGLTVRALYSNWTPCPQEASDAIQLWRRVQIAVKLLPLVKRMIAKQMISTKPEYA